MNYKQIARLNFYGCTYEEFTDIRKDIEKTYSDILFYDCDCGFTKKLRVGNYCFPGLPLEVAQEIEAKYQDQYKCHIDNILPIFTEDQISSFKTGDKVTVFQDTIFGGMKNKGTIHSITNTGVMVRMYRSQNKGWFLPFNMVGGLTLGWN